MILQSKKVLALSAQLTLRNSQFYEIMFNSPQVNELDKSIVIPSTANLQALKLKLMEYNLKDIKFICNNNLQIAEVTPLQSLLNQQFYISTSEYMNVGVTGQLQQVIIQDTPQNGLRNLQLPIVKRKNIQDYIQRINKVINMKYGKSQNQNQIIKIKTQEACEVMVQALIDPLPQDRQIHIIEQQWHRLYMRNLQLKHQKQKAQVKCNQKVNRFMIMGIGLFVSNIGVVWGGTYYIYSWDIIQPFAYFLDSFAAIVFGYMYFKIRRQYSHYNFRKYLMQKWLPKTYQQCKFNINQYNKNLLQMRQLQSVIKDHYLKNI